MKKQLLSGILGASLAGFGLVGTLPQPAQACNIFRTGIRCIKPIGGSSGGNRRPSGGGMGGRSPKPDYSDLGRDSGRLGRDDDYMDADDSLVLPPAGSTGGYLTGGRIKSVDDFYRVHGRMPTRAEALRIPGTFMSGDCVQQGNTSYCGLK